MTAIMQSGDSAAGRAGEPVSMERRCQVAGCSTVFIAPTLDELRCPSCRSARRRAAPGGQSLYGCTAARCAGV
jgi:hypothetical protein